MFLKYGVEITEGVAFYFNLNVIVFVRRLYDRQVTLLKVYFLTIGINEWKYSVHLKKSNIV